MNSVEAQPFTMDLMKLDKLLGLGGFNMEFNATGASQAAIMSSLDGKGGFDLNDGAIKGVNIVKLAGAVATQIVIVVAAGFALGALGTTQALSGGSSGLNASLSGGDLGSAAAILGVLAAIALAVSAWRIRGLDPVDAVDQGADL